MVFTKQEKEVLIKIVKKELKEMETEEDRLDKLHGSPINPKFRAAEEKYEYILEQILKKLK